MTADRNTEGTGRKEKRKSCSIARDRTLTPLRPDPFQVRITASNYCRLHDGLVKRLPNIGLFSRDWFRFVFTGCWYGEVERRLVEIDRRVAREGRDLCPAAHRIWRWAELVGDPTNVRVVIVGQDPYTQMAKDSRAGGKAVPMADGLAFSVSREYYDRVKRQPPSLVNILRAVARARGKNHSAQSDSARHDGNLERWSRQGVLLLNDVLTAPGGGGGECANSHKDFGWQFVTNAVISRLGSGRMSHRVFFMLWGRSAGDSKSPLIRSEDRVDAAETPLIETLHRVFKCHHPSPLSVNRKGEFPHEQFNLCDEMLTEDGHRPIEWL